MELSAGGQAGGFLHGEELLQPRWCVLWLEMEPLCAGEFTPS